MKALVGTFNTKKALVEAFSVIVKTDCEIDGSSYSYSTSCNHHRGQLVVVVLGQHEGGGVALGGEAG